MTETDHTLTTRPQWWAGPGVLFGLSRTECDTEPAATANAIDQALFAQLSGSRLRIAQWEDRWPGTFTDSLDESSGTSDTSTVGDHRVLDDFTRDGPSGFSFELDLSWNDDDEKASAYERLNSWLPDQLRDLVNSLADLDPHAVNENRPVAVDSRFADLKPCVIDLPVDSLPSSRQRTRSLVCGTRWVRVIVTKFGLVALWYPTTSTWWTPQNVPWPHNGIPSREKSYLDRIQTASITADERISAWFEDVLTHESYHLQTWHTELEYWQDAVFNWLTGHLTLSDVDGLRTDLGLLSGYLASARWTQRAMLRRSKESGLSEAYPTCAHMLSESQQEMSEEIDHDRSLLPECFSTLSMVSQRLQEDAAKQAQKSADRLNSLITLFTTVLLVPTVVAGIYGANIASLAEGAKGSLTELLVLMAGFATVSFGLLSILRKRWTVVVISVVCGTSCIVGFEVLHQVQSTLQVLAPYWAAISVCVFVAISITVTVRSRSNASA